MKLGNSNGNNRGKKYLRRKDYNTLNISSTSYYQLDRFNNWFTDSFDELKRVLIYKECYDEDILNETYTKICESILYKSLEIKDYKSYFHRSYFTNYVNNKVQNNRYTTLGTYDILDTRINNANERERDIVILEEEIFKYVYDKYTKKEFEIFKMYVSLKPAINYYTLSDIINVQTHVIQRIISKILNDIRNNKMFLSKYYTINYISAS